LLPLDICLAAPVLVVADVTLAINAIAVNLEVAVAAVVAVGVDVKATAEQKVVIVNLFVEIFLVSAICGLKKELNMQALLTCLE